MVPFGNYNIDMAYAASKLTTTRAMEPIPATAQSGVAISPVVTKSFTTTGNHNIGNERNKDHHDDGSSGTGSGSPCKLTKYFNKSFPTMFSSFTANSTEKELPDDFEPSEYDIVCGRGKGSYDRSSNRLFRNFVAQFVVQYKSCRTKLDKSRLLEQIVVQVKEQLKSNNKNDTDNSTHHPVIQTRFVKYDTTRQRWYEVSNDHAREKVGHAMRVAVESSDKKDNKTDSISIKKKSEQKQPKPKEKQPLSPRRRKSTSRTTGNVAKAVVATAGRELDGVTPTVNSNRKSPPQQPLLLDHEIFKRQTMMFQHLSQQHQQLQPQQPQQQHPQGPPPYPKI